MYHVKHSGFDVWSQNDSNKQIDLSLVDRGLWELIVRCMCFTWNKSDQSLLWIQGNGIGQIKDIGLLGVDQVYL